MKTLFWGYVAVFVLTAALLIGAAVAAMLDQKTIGLPIFFSFLASAAVLFTMRRIVQRKIGRG